MNACVNNQKILQVRENFLGEGEKAQIDLLIAKITKQRESLRSDLANCKEAVSSLERGIRQLKEKDLAIIEVDEQIRKELEEEQEILEKAKELLKKDIEEVGEVQVEEEPSSKKEHQQTIAQEISELKMIIDQSLGANPKPCRSAHERGNQPAQHWPSIPISFNVLGRLIRVFSFKPNPPNLSPFLKELDQLINFLSQNQTLLQMVTDKLCLRDIKSLRDQFLEADRIYQTAQGIDKESGRITLCKAELALYDSVLRGIIEQVHSHQILIKKQNSHRVETVRLQKEIGRLDHLFNIYFLKYEELYKHLKDLESSQTFQETSFSGRMENIFKGILTIFVESHAEPKMHLYNKRLADLAYSMSDEIEKYYSKIKKLKGSELDKAIIEQFKGFLKWAKTNPKRASYLMGDIVCAYFYLTEANNLTEECANIAKSLKAIIFTQAYLDALGQGVDQPDDENELRFKALADLVSMVKKGTIIYKIGRGVWNRVGRGTNCALAIFAECGSAVMQEAAVNKIRDFISEVNPVYTSLLLNIIQGKGISDILADQRNLALLKFAGGISKFEWKHLQMELEIWLKTVREAKWGEKRDRLLFQLLLPVGGAMVGIALIVAELSGYLFLLGASFSIAVLITSGSIASSYLITKYYINKNSAFQATYNKARDAIQEIWNNKLKKNFFKKIEHKKIIVDETKIYLEELKKRDILFFSPYQRDSSIESKYRMLISDKSRELKEKLEKEFELALIELDGLNLCLSQKSLKQMSIPIAVFCKIVSLNNLRNEIKSEIKTNLINHEEDGVVGYSAHRFNVNHVDKIIFSIYDDLINNWLEAKVEAAFEKQLMNFYTSGVASVNGTVDEETFKEQIKAHIRNEAGLNSDAEAAEIKEAIGFYERRYIINTRMSKKGT